VEVAGVPGDLDDGDVGSRRVLKADSSKNVMMNPKRRFKQDIPECEVR
jgi:hypothetical protein